MSPEQRRAYVRRMVDEMPPLTSEQRMDLRQMLHADTPADVKHEKAQQAA